jgi:type IV secretion system protein VirB8
MALKDKINEVVSKVRPSESSAADLEATKNWYTDRYEGMLVQRNLLFVLILIAFATIIFLTFSVSFIKGTKSIEPFVIEIEPKTGVPTVVEPLSVVAFTANEAISRYFIWHYIQLREEYFPATYRSVYQKVRLFSADDVYGSYARSMSTNNPRSPVNLYGATGTRMVEMKSLVLQDKNTAQVRLRSNASSPSGAVTSSGTGDKIVYLSFTYNNLEMSDDKRVINPLGFTVTAYRIEDERL